MAGSVSIRGQKRLVAARGQVSHGHRPCGVLEELTRRLSQRGCRPRERNQTQIDAHVAQLRGGGCRGHQRIVQRDVRLDELVGDLFQFDRDFAGGRFRLAC